jgi:Protein of unknown function (DUF2634)/LysM domain
MPDVQLGQYYNIVDQTLKAFENLYASVKISMDQIENPEYDSNDWYGALWGIQNTINQLQTMANVHKFERVSQDQMQAIFTSFDNGTPTGKTVVSIAHTITDFDTLRLIEVKYGIPWQNILDFNNMSPSDFVIGAVVNIPVQVNIMPEASTQIAVVGDQSGLNILGADLPDEIIDDGNGDLLVLDPLSSFQQAVDNLITTPKGELPYYEDYGVDLILPEQYPVEAQESMIQVRLNEALSADPRIKEITILDVSKSGNTIQASLQVQPLVGEPINASI